MNRVSRAALERALKVDNGGLDFIKNILNEEIEKTGFNYSESEYSKMFDDVIYGLAKERSI